MDGDQDRLQQWRTVHAQRIFASTSHTATTARFDSVAMTMSDQEPMDTSSEESASPMGTLQRPVARAANLTLGVPPRFLLPLQRAHQAVAGREAKFFCKLAASDDTIIVWKKDGEIMEIIDEVFLEDQGSISCEASNAYGRDLTTCYLTVTDADPMLASAPSSALFQEMHEFIEEHNVDEIEVTDVPPPKIIQGINSYRVPPGITLTIHCEVDSTTPVTFEWAFNERSITTSDKQHSIQTVGKHSTLTIHKPAAGLYRMQATNQGGAATSYGNVQIVAKPDRLGRLAEERVDVQEIGASRFGGGRQQKPSFTHQVPAMTIRRGDRLYLDVAVNASPPADFQWFVDGQLVQPDSVHSTFYRTVEIFSGFENRSCVMFQQPKSGLYKVVAGNSQGSTSSMAHIIVEDTPVRTIRTPQMGRADAQHLTGSLTESGIAASASSQTHSMHASGTGEYTEEHFVDEIELQNVKPPKFLQGIESYRITKEAQLTIAVEVISEAPVTFEWFHNDIRIPDNYVQSSGRRTVLRTAVGLDGVYKVRAINAGGVATSYGCVTLIDKEQLLTEAQVTKTGFEVAGAYSFAATDTSVQVGWGPIFTHALPTISIRPGSPLTLDVAVTASPPASFKWYKDGHELHIAQLTLIDNNRCRALLPQAEPGMYSVTATNQYGSSESHAHVYMQEDTTTRSGYYEEHNDDIIPMDDQPPHFIEDIKSYRIPAGAMLTIPVQVASQPRCPVLDPVKCPGLGLPSRATFDWFFNDQPISDGPDFSIQKSLNRSVLTARRPMAGMFKVRATNPAGAATSYGCVVITRWF